MKRSHSQGRSVLIVDDDRDTREMYGESLRAIGFDVITASSAEEALRLAAQVCPAVLVTDLRLRGRIDGAELAQRLRKDERTKNTRVIMLTGAAFGIDRDRAEGSGCDRFLLKPCLPDTLASEIRQVSAGQVAPTKRGGINHRHRIHDSSSRRTDPTKM